MKLLYKILCKWFLLEKNNSIKYDLNYHFLSYDCSYFVIVMSVET